MWITAIVSAAISLFAFLFLPETYKPILNQSRSTKQIPKRPTQTVGNWLARFKKVSVLFLQDYLSRPVGQYFFILLLYRFLKRCSMNVYHPTNDTDTLGLLATEPILVLITLYMSFCYGLLFLFIEGYPVAFQEVRGWSPQLSSLTFVGLLVGVGCGMLGVIVHALKVLAKKSAIAQEGKLVPEQLLPPMISGAVVLPLGLFCFAWTSHSHITWIPQAVAGIPVGAAMFAILIQGIKYIVDVFFRYANSAISANTIVRSFFAAGFPLFAMQMYHNLGVPWATSTLAFFAIAFIPVPIVFFLFGHKIRTWSRSAIHV